MSRGGDIEDPSCEQPSLSPRHTNEHSPLLGNLSSAEDRESGSFAGRKRRADEDCGTPFSSPAHKLVKRSSAVFVPPPLRGDQNVRIDPQLVMEQARTVLQSSRKKANRGTSSESSFLSKLFNVGSGEDDPLTARDILVGIGQSIPSILIAIMLVLMTCIPFGLSFFPAEWEEIPEPRAIGIQMYLFTTVVCQLVFTFTSSFNGPVGVMMVENIPFMHTLSMSILNELGRSHPGALATIVVTYSISSIFVGILFYIIGYLHMGSIIYFIPKHIIIGAIGGIGIFVIQTGFENAVGQAIRWNWEGIKSLFEGEIFFLWFSAAMLVVLLHVLSRCVQSPFFAPIYFLSIPPLFYVVVYALGISMDSVVANGWFFAKARHVNFWDMWLLFDFRLVEWWVIPKQIGTLIGLSIFSLMHVPINIPSLSLTTGHDADMNEELKSHGYSNLLGGLTGTVQNYLCYSFSALYFKCGGGIHHPVISRICGIIIAFITMIFFFCGPNIVAYIPRCMAGCLMMHIGWDLLKEAVIDPFGDLDLFEYLTVWTITLSMAIWGMNQGLAIGAVLACVTFVFQSAPTGPLRGSMSGATLRSSTWRNRTAVDILAKESRSIHVVQLQGHIFFGNIGKLGSYIEEVFAKHSSPSIKYLVLDFTLVIAMDASAVDRLMKLKRLCNKKRCHFVCASIPEKYKRLEQQMITAFELSKHKTTKSVSPGSCADYCRFYVAKDLNSAIELCEDGLLDEYVPTMSTPDRHRVLQKPWQASTSISETSPATVGSVQLLPDDEDENVHLNQLKALCPDEPFTVLHRLLEYFNIREVDQGELLWKQGDKSDCALLLVDGKLKAELEEEAGTTEELSVGSLVGELCLLTKERRKTTVRALERSVVYVLTEQSLIEMLEKDSYLAFLFQGIALKYTSYRLQYVGNRIWETKCLPI